MEKLNSQGLVEKLRKFKKQPDYGCVGNEALYKMCRRYPYHKNKAEIIGKVWLIGRSYAVSLERNRNNKKISDDFYKEKVAPTFIKKFDNLLIDIRKLKELDKKNISIILKTHKRVVRFIHREITKDNKRSFASKYLHFHFPKLFFIFDSRTAGMINSIVSEIGGSRKKYRNILKKTSGFDKTYANFFVKCFYLWNFCKNCKINLDLRQIDSFLIEEANKKRRKRKTK